MGLPDSLSAATALFVTGAAGCVGRALLERLAADGARVIGMDLLAQPRGLTAEMWIEDDILNEESYSGQLVGVDTIFHLAAEVHYVPRTIEEAERFWKINLEGTRKLIEVAAKKGVRRFVYVSTVGAHSSARDGLRDAYAQSKSAAEKVALEFRERMKIIIVRPAIVYGPYDKGNIFKLVKWIERGLPPIIGSGNNRKSMVFVRNLAEALLFLSEKGENGETYVVTDGRDLSMNEIVEVICYALGTTNRWPLIPLPLARGIATANEWWAKKLRIPRFLDREMIEKLTEETVFDPAPLFSLGFSPICSFQEGIGETVQWYKHSGH